MQISVILKKYGTGVTIIGSTTLKKGGNKLIRFMIIVDSLPIERSYLLW